MANYGYGGGISNGINGDWVFLKKSDSNSDNSYFGAAFKNTNTGEIVITNRGSTTDQDWGVTDKDIVERTVAPAFFDAEDFANSIKADPKNSGFSIFETGHSLGGAEAQYVAAELGLSGATFSAPGMQWAVPGATANITNYVFDGEPIGQFGSHVGTLVTIEPDLSKPTEQTNVLISGVFDDVLLPKPLTLAVGLVGPYWGLHGIENYTEYYGISAPPGAAGVSGATGVFDLVAGLATDIAAGIVEPQSTLPVSTGGTATISHDFLWSFEAFKTPEQLTYTIIDQPAHGMILDNGMAAASFTQADIDNGLVRYVENGDPVKNDSFTFQVSDPDGRHTVTEPFSIAILDHTGPVVATNNTLAAPLGGSAGPNHFILDSVSVGNTPDEMIYQLTAAPQHGALLVGGVAFPLFTQAQIDEGLVGYINNGDGATGDSFSFVAWDANAEWTAGTFNILIEPAAGSAAAQQTVADGAGSSTWQGSVPDGYQVAGVGNFHGNGSSDILLRNSASGDIGELRSDNGMNFSDIGWAAAGWEVAGTTDVNGDGTTDIVLQFPGSGAIGAFIINDGHPTWSLLGSTTQV